MTHPCPDCGVSTLGYVCENCHKARTQPPEHTDDEESALRDARICINRAVNEIATQVGVSFGGALDTFRAVVRGIIQDELRYSDRLLEIVQLEAELEELRAAAVALNEVMKGADFQFPVGATVVHKGVADTKEDDDKHRLWIRQRIACEEQDGHMEKAYWCSKVSRDGEIATSTSCFPECELVLSKPF